MPLLSKSSGAPARNRIPSYAIKPIWCDVPPNGYLCANGHAAILPSMCSDISLERNRGGGIDSAMPMVAQGIKNSKSIGKVYLVRKIGRASCRDRVCQYV